MPPHQFVSFCLRSSENLIATNNQQAATSNRDQSGQQHASEMVKTWKDRGMCRPCQRARPGQSPARQPQAVVYNSTIKRHASARPWWPHVDGLRVSSTTCPLGSGGVGGDVGGT